MKDTPRTDTEADFVYDPHHKKGPDVEVVDATFARRLERELAAMTERATTCSKRQASRF